MLPLAARTHRLTAGTRAIRLRTLLQAPSARQLSFKNSLEWVKAGSPSSPSTAAVSKYPLPKPKPPTEEEAAAAREEAAARRAAEEEERQKSYGSPRPVAVV